MEVAIVGIHSPAFVPNSIVELQNQDFSYTVWTSQIIAVISLVRMYMIIKLFGRFSKYQTPEVVLVW